MNHHTIITDDSIITTRTTVTSRYVDFGDIIGKVEPDDYGEAPWECDGWEHSTTEANKYYDHRDRRYGHDYYNNGRQRGYIEVTDETAREWLGPVPGQSKQVRAESIAVVKRKATEQLVKWYKDGWEVWYAVAEYDDYVDSIGGFYGDYLDPFIVDDLLECRLEVVSQLEADGYIVANKPERPKYDKVQAFRDRIRRQLTL